VKHKLTFLREAQREFGHRNGNRIARSVWSAPHSGAFDFILPAACDGLSVIRDVDRKSAGIRRTPNASRNSGRLRPGRGAFSLIEIMVAVSLMSFIVLGLLIMFGQVQKAFRASLTQTDVLEAGRIQMDMMVRELAQVAPSGRRFTTNLLIELSPVFNVPFLQGLPGTTYKGIPGTQDQRTNIIQKIFFLSQFNQDWIGTGYQVIPDYANSGVGTLYRFSANYNRSIATNLSGEFLNAPLSKLHRISDGVVHLRLRPFATNGYPIVWDGRTNGVFRTNAFDTGGLRVKNTIARGKLLTVPDVVDCYFMSNALPAYLELEVGILEQHIFERFKAIGTNNAAAQQRYLSNHVGQVHIFRQRIPVRTVDFSAYQ
jgi:type II secretory pathway pseudopilin PulG